MSPLLSFWVVTRPKSGMEQRCPFRQKGQMVDALSEKDAKKKIRSELAPYEEIESIQVHEQKRPSSKEVVMEQLKACCWTNPEDPHVSQALRTAREELGDGASELDVISRAAQILWDRKN